MSFLRSQIYARSRLRLVEPKSLMPERFGKKSGWSYLARSVVGLVHSGLKQEMKNTENRKQPISVSNLQEFVEVVRGGAWESGLEQCED